MLTITIVFLLAALVTVVASAVGKCPLFVPVLLLWVVAALQVLPIR